MFQFVKQYAVQEAILLLVAAMGWLWRKVAAGRKEDRVLKSGIVALLHDRLYQECVRVIRQGYCSVEERSNLEYLYRPYKSLGGNGTGTQLYTTCMGLPLEKPEDSE